MSQVAAAGLSHMQQGPCHGVALLRASIATVKLPLIAPLQTTVACKIGLETGDVKVTLANQEYAFSKNLLWPECMI